MAPDMRDNTKMELKKDMGNIYGKMDLTMMEIGQITSLMAKY